MIVENLLNQFGYFPTLLFLMFWAGVLSSGIIEVGDTLNKYKRNAKARNAAKRVLIFHTWYMILIVCVVTTIIVFFAAKVLFIDKNTGLVNYGDVLLAMVSNIVFANLFYMLGGRKVVKALVKKWGINKYEDDLGKIE